MKVHGVWTEKALNHFRDFLKLRGLAPSDDELMTILRQAKERYLDGHGCLSVCAAEPSFLPRSRQRAIGKPFWNSPDRLAPRAR